ELRKIADPLPGATVISTLCLSNLLRSTSFQAMLKKCFVPFAVAWCSSQVLQADTIQLKDQAAIVGKVLAEKRDQVAVDVGYTVLVIPRNQIVKVSHTDVAEPKTKTVANKKVVVENETKAESTAMETSTGFYSVSSRPLPARTVRD